MPENISDNTLRKQATLLIWETSLDISNILVEYKLGMIQVIYEVFRQSS